MIVLTWTILFLQLGLRCYAVEWTSEKLPLDCHCEQWNETAFSTDIKWETYPFLEPTKYKRGLVPRYCRYGVKIERKVCMRGTTGEQSSLHKPACSVSQIMEHRSFYLKNNQCSRRFEKSKVAETCEDNNCQIPYRRSFTPCYKRKLLKETMFFCRVDWERCDVESCRENARGYRVFHTTISANCSQSDCSSVMSQGIVTYLTTCEHVSKFSGQSGDRPPCNPATFVQSDLQTLQCQRSSYCKPPTTNMTFMDPVDSTYADIDYYGGTTFTESQDPENYPDYTWSFTSPPITETTVEVVSVPWRGFITAIILGGIALLLIILCLTAILCRTLVCAQGEGKVGLYELMKKSRDSLERGMSER